MKLYDTPRSRFSRKVLRLLDAQCVSIELVDVGNVGDATAFADNPLMKVLVDGDPPVFDSDHIAAYRVRQLDPADRFGVTTQETSALNARAVMNGIMAAEVEVSLAQRSGMQTTGVPHFAKLQRSMTQGLAWLETHADVFPEAPSYLGFHLVALWDHLALYGRLPPIAIPTLTAGVEALSRLDSVRASAPQ